MHQRPVLSGCPSSVQKIGVPRLMPRSARRSSHRTIIAKAVGSKPTVRARLPLPFSTRTVLALLSRSLGLSARASEMGSSSQRSGV
jgi:hypothetical protein